MPRAQAKGKKRQEAGPPDSQRGGCTNGWSWCSQANHQPYPPAGHALHLTTPPLATPTNPLAVPPLATPHRPRPPALWPRPLTGRTSPTGSAPSAEAFSVLCPVQWTPASGSSFETQAFSRRGSECSTWTVLLAAHRSAQNSPWPYMSSSFALQERDFRHRPRESSQRSPGGRTEAWGPPCTSHSQTCRPPATTTGSGPATRAGLLLAQLPAR